MEKGTILVTYIRDKRIRPIVEEKDEIIEKKTGSGKIKRLRRTWVRLGKGRLRGVVTSMGRDSVGWALCDKKDFFDKKEAIRIATDREIKKEDISNAPPSIRKSLLSMLERSRRFYK